MLILAHYGFCLFPELMILFLKDSHIVSQFLYCTLPNGLSSFPVFILLLILLSLMILILDILEVNAFLQ